MMDWLDALDVTNATKNVRTEFYGDWYVDPWDWPELHYIERKKFEPLVEHLESDRVGRVAELDIPKENWGTRPAVLLGILDRLVYQALVDRQSLSLIGNLSAGTYGWRLPPGADERGKYARQDFQWTDYRSHLAAGAAWFEYGLTTDVVSCFATITLDLARDTIDDACQKGKVTDRLTSFLSGVGRVSPREGLPQRSTASAVIANRVLSAFDVVLADYGTDIPGFILDPPPSGEDRRSFVRWMDDMWLFGDSEASLRRAQIELQRLAHSLGLNLGTAKTNLYGGDALMEAATQIQHSAVDNALVVNDTGPLEELVDSCLDQESKAGRTSVKFAINRMLKAKSRYKAKELIAVSHEFPHAADSLAHLFAQVFTPESLEGWFLEGTGSDWWIFDWSTSHYLRIFPSNYEPGSRLIEWVSDKVASGSSNVPLLAVCAQRLASWNPEKYRSAMRAGMERSNNPHVRRILALCALVATEPRRNVSRWLGQEEENRITLDMLEDSSFVAPKVNAGYARAT